MIGYLGQEDFLSYLIGRSLLEKRLVTVHSDLTPDRRLYATGGQARALYQELVRNMSTRAKPDGGALSSVVERFVTSAVDASRERGVKPDVVIRERLAALSEMVNGYDFAEVIAVTGKDTTLNDTFEIGGRWMVRRRLQRERSTCGAGVRDDRGRRDCTTVEFTRAIRRLAASRNVCAVDELVTYTSSPIQRPATRTTSRFCES